MSRTKQVPMVRVSNTGPAASKGCVGPGKKNKTITHRLERAAAKRTLNEEK